MNRRTVAVIGLSLLVALMAAADPHPRSAGVSDSLLTAAQYPKVYVHLLGGMGLYSILIPLLESAGARVLLTGLLGFVYELLQLANLGGGERGVFTFTEGAAVLLGAVILAVWQELLPWHPVERVSLHR